MISVDGGMASDFALPGDEAEAASLTAMIPGTYDELRSLAAGYLRGERPNHTLQPTALVHEAYLRLLDQSSIHWRNRAHFLGVAATMMRRILINYAEARAASKRQAQVQAVALDEALDIAGGSPVDLLDLHHYRGRCCAGPEALQTAREHRWR